MAVQKLSQITPSPPTSPSDQIVGVIGGTTDTLYSLLQLADLAPAPSDLDFYLDPTGSDSNNGMSSLMPFLTPQYAVNFATSYNYLGQFFPTIHVADGTYVVPNTIVLREITGGISFNYQAVIACNPSNPGNVVFDASAVGPGLELFAALNPASNWQVDGFQGNMTGAMFLAIAGGKISAVNDLIANDPTNGGLMYVFDLQQGGIGRGPGGTISVLSTTIAGFCQAQTNADFLTAGTTINLQANTISTNGIFFITGKSGCVQVGTTFTGSILSSPGSAAVGLSEVETTNGLASDFPDGLFTDLISILTQPGATNAFQGYFLTAPPTSGNLDVQNTWGFFLDSTSGIPWLANNVGSNLWITPLAGNAEGLPYQITVPSTGDHVTSALLLKCNILTPAGTLATLTVDLPTGQLDGFTTRISTSQTITAITFATTDATTIFSAPSTLLANTGVQFVWNDNLGIWYVG